MNLRPTWLAVAAASAALALTHAAQAQDNDDDDLAEDLLDEITVTARKREERLRDVPVAVTAVTAQTIERAGIDDVQDLALLSPGLSYREGFGRSTGDANNRPSIRGMSSILGNPNAAFFIDGVYVDGPIASYSLENLERIEVLRGPQATTFGRGTFAGAVNFITRRPGDRTEAQLKSTVGSHDHYAINGYVAGPLVPNVLSAEINAEYYDRGEDPEYDNLAPGGALLGAERTSQVGLKLNWTPTEYANFYLNVNWSDVSDESFAYGKFNGGDNNTAAEINSVSPDKTNCFGPTFNPFVPIFTVNRSRGYYCGEITIPGAYWVNTGGLDGASRETLVTNLIAEFDFEDWSLTSTTGLTKYDYVNAFPSIDNSPTDAVSWGGRDNNKTFSQEIHLRSPAENRLRYDVGGYFYRQEDGDGFSASFFANAGQTFRDVDIAANSFSDDSVIENRALFGGIDWDASDKLTLSAELRWQEEEQTLAGFDANGLPQYDGSPTATFTATLPRVAFTWEATDNYNIYGSIAEGNNPGGFNADYYDVRFVRSERQIFVADRGIYDESEVTAYELGLKGVFWNQRLAANIALYFNDWEKQALTDSDALTQVSNGAQTTVAYITNAGKSEVQGIEIELLARLSDNFDLGLNYALADTEIKDYFDENYRDLLDTNGIYTGRDAFGNQIVDTEDPSGQVAGNELPQTPKHMANLNATLRFPMQGSSEMYARLDYNYESKRYVQTANLAWIGASEDVNLRIGWENENWDLALWVNNLTNDDTPEVVTRLLDFRRFFLIPSQERVSGLRGTFIRDFTVTAPRSTEYGATLIYRF